MRQDDHETTARPPRDSVETLLSCTELAGRLGISVQHVKRLATGGRIPSIRLRRDNVRFLWNDVIQALRDPPKASKARSVPSEPTACKSVAVPEPLGGPEAGSAERLADLWLDYCGSNPQPARPLAKGIRATLDAALRREKDRDWPDTFARVAASGFLSGQKTDFRASIIWATGVKNLAKIDAGQYDDGPPVQPKKTGYLAQQDAACEEAIRERLGPARKMTDAEMDRTF